MVTQYFNNLPSKLSLGFRLPPRAPGEGWVSRVEVGGDCPWQRIPRGFSHPTLLSGASLVCVGPNCSRNAASYPAGTVHALVKRLSGYIFKIYIIVHSMRA